MRAAPFKSDSVLMC